MSVILTYMVFNLPILSRDRTSTYTCTLIIIVISMLAYEKFAYKPSFVEAYDSG